MQILCALSTTARRVPAKTPKEGVYYKWKQEVITLLEYATDLDHIWHVNPDDILEVTQRLGKLGETEAVRLAPWQCLRALPSAEIKIHFEVLEASSNHLLCREVEAIQGLLRTQKLKRPAEKLQLKARQSSSDLKCVESIFAMLLRCSSQDDDVAPALSMEDLGSLLSCFCTSRNVVED